MQSTIPELVKEQSQGVTIGTSLEAILFATRRYERGHDVPLTILYNPQRVGFDLPRLVDMFHREYRSSSPVIQELESHNLNRD